MEEQKKILVLCGGKFAFKALQLLAYEKFLCGVGIGKGDDRIIDALEQESEENGMSFRSFPDKKSMSSMKEWIEEMQPDYIFSISFPFLITEDILAYGTEKFINFHPAQLPQYRGPMPIFEVLRNQEKETAVSVHFMNSKFDEGNIIFKDIVPIDTNDTYGKLTVKLSERMAHVVLNTANMVQYANKIPNTPQEKEKAYYFEKPDFSDTYIHWKRMSAQEITALINACNPWNIGADATFQGEQVKIIAASVRDEPHNGLAPGMIVSIAKDQSLNVASSDNKQIAIEIISTEEGIMTSKQLNTQKFLIGTQFN
ncbi:methionyl-tRNA formyltransferase [Flavobacterium humi]|uniref:Methionyl-tRNA formyltransferase n=1 Tax=Flavobacterium humi TaxID=2562683 RepID=A0A4Z0L2J1_9FLAO|nr:formyltransferase family protein [Flavobacterium humi]TGD56653.1 methionyl-tRNA formyltransferase [Flavobacterium humi]